ncbi:MAG: EAL domain-containing protein [bacterium]
MNRVDFHSGYHILHIDPLVRPERLIYQALEEVKYAAYFKEKIDERKRYDELRQIIYNKQISTVYQPIYNLSDNTLYGYEALSRGPVGSYFENPDIIFLYASKGDLLMPVEEICLYQAVRNARFLADDELLFINITPTLIPSLINDDFADFLKDYGFDNHHMVLELTEKFAIPDHSLYQRILVNTKGHGYKIALDDVGIGYSTLERISEITPDYLKFDRSLVRDINKNLVRQELAKSFVEFAKKINAIIIAEGIENEEELDFVKSIGINYGQGFLLGSPK